MSEREKAALVTLALLALAMLICSAADHIWQIIANT